MTGLTFSHVVVDSADLPRWLQLGASAAEREPDQPEHAQQLLHLLHQPLQDQVLLAIPMWDLLLRQSPALTA